MQELLEEAKKHIAEHEKYKRVFSEFDFLYEEWKKKYSNFHAQKTETKLTVQKLKLKVVQKNEKSLYSDVEALRYVLEQEMLRLGLKKIRYQTDFKLANALYFPYMFKQGEYRDTLYKVDIQKCFYSIYSRLGVDTQVIASINLHKKKIQLHAVGRGRLTEEESIIIKDLEFYKTLRNAVYGLTRACFITVFKPNGRPERQYIRGKLQNLDLTVAIASFLHSFVQKFKKFIVYWNIDGGIIYPEGFEQMQKYLSELGFTLKKEAEGEAIILGLGSYKVGEYETAHFQRGLCAHRESAEYLMNVEGAEKIEKWFRR